MKRRIVSEPVKRIYLLGMLPFICGAFFSCKTEASEDIHVPMTVVYQNLSGVTVGVYNSNQRRQDNLLVTLDPRESTTVIHKPEETNRPNSEGKYYLQFYFPVYGNSNGYNSNGYNSNGYTNKVPLVLPAGRGDMVEGSPVSDSSGDTMTMTVTIPPLSSLVTPTETLPAVTNAYIVLKNEYGLRVSFRKDETPLEREDEDEKGTKKGTSIPYNESGVYKIPAGSDSAGYDIHNGSEFRLLPPITFAGGKIYYFSYSVGGVISQPDPASKDFTLAELGITG
jgi:hypothetical protein